MEPDKQANNDPISQSLNITPLPQKSNAVKAIIADAHDDSAMADFEVARSNLHTMLETAKEAIDNLAQIANQSQAPRAFEVLAKLIDTTTSTSRSLLDLQDRIRAIKNADEPHSNEAKTINNNLIVAPTAEVLKLIKNATTKIADESNE